jgi:hypothetical protein
LFLLAVVGNALPSTTNKKQKTMPKKDKGTLVPRINVENGIKLGSV